MSPENPNPGSLNRLLSVAGATLAFAVMCGGPCTRNSYIEGKALEKATAAQVLSKKEIPALNSKIDDILGAHTCENIPVEKFSELIKEIETTLAPIDSQFYTDKIPAETRKELETAKLELKRYRPQLKKDGALDGNDARNEINAQLTHLRWILEKIAESDLGEDSSIETNVKIMRASLRRFDDCYGDELKIDSSEMEKLWAEIEPRDLDDDGKLSVFENGLAIRQPMLADLEERLTLAEHQTSFNFEGTGEPLELTPLNISSILYSRGLTEDDEARWAVSELYNLDTTTEGNINRTDDITYDGIVDGVDFRAIRALHAYFESRYGERFSKGKVTTNDMIFAYMDLAGPMMADSLGLDRSRLDAGYMDAQATGFKPVKTRLSLNRESAERIIYQTVTRTKHIPGKTSYRPSFSGLGGAAGFALGTLMGFGPVGSAIMGGIGGTSTHPVTTQGHTETTTQEEEVGKIVKTAEHFRIRTEGNKMVRVIVVTTEDNKEIYLLDTAAGIEEEEIVRIVNEYRHGKLQHTSRSVEQVQESTEVNMQETSGRIAVRDLQSNRVALFQEAGGNIKYQSIYNIVDHGTPEFMGGKNTANLAQGHLEAIEELFAIPELAKLREIRHEYAMEFNPREALTHESTQLGVTQNILGSAPKSEPLQIDL